MAIRFAVQNGDNNQTSTWNDGATLGLPTSADDVFTNGFTVNMVANATYLSLNNSARARDIATTQMTSNTTPSPVSIATSSTQSGNLGWFAFDRNYATTTNFWQAGAATGWISVDFGSGNATIIDAYTVFASSAQTNNMRNWTFEGSNDNVNWTILQTVTLPSAIAASSTYASGSIGNVTAYRYYRVNITLNGGGGVISTTEIELYRSGTAALAAGGSFNFNTAGVTVTCTSTSASLSAGATNLITVTATTGTVTLNLGSSVTGLGFGSTIINHSGNCNLTINGQNFTGGTATPAYCINKSSAGTLTVTGGGFFGGTITNAAAINSTNGNTVVNGNVVGTAVVAIIHTAGNLTINGSVTGGSLTVGISSTNAASSVVINGNVTGGTGAGCNAITLVGTGTITGNILGGTNATAHGINTTGPLIVNGNVLGSFWPAILSTNTVTVTGNVIAGASTAISSTSANTINVTGDVYASATANGISSTNANGVVNLTGNMYNGLGRNAIYCQNVFISNTATTLWRMDTGGGDYKFLYSADTTPNLPATTNVRSGVTFGPALSLTGTMVVPAASDVRENVPVDNTVGTAELTSADIISGINASSDPLAVRLKNALTDVTAGNIISQYKDS